MDEISDTLQERGKCYGEFEDLAGLSQDLKAIMHASGNWRHLSAPKKEALELICNKLARILNGDSDYADSWHDIAGYVTLVERTLLDAR